MNGKVDKRSAAQELLALKGAYRDRGLTFRYNPHSTIPSMRWVAVREVVEPITMSDGNVELLTRWELRGWGATANDLAAQLA